MIPVTVWREVVEEGFETIKNAEKTLERDIESRIEKEMDYVSLATVLVGVRRSGKTTLALRLVKKRNACYINFEDERLLSATLQDLTSLSKLIEGYDIVVLDEIQNIEGWPKWLRRMIDKRRQKFIVTGSNASLLRGEYASSITGRKKTFVVYPFSYKEVKKHFSLSLEDYIQTGGFPEVLLKKDKELAKEYADDILYRDIAMRHKVREINDLRKMYFHILNNPGIIVSKKRLSAITSLSSPTIRKFLSYMEESFSILTCKKYSRSAYESMTQPQKVYPVDNGFVSEKTNGRGLLLESVVYQTLSRIGVEAFYLREKHYEVDFVVNSKGIQVTYSLTGENARRELRPLKKLGGLLIAMYGYEYIDERDVEIVSAEEFLLNPEQFLENLKL